jgi:hypothetical protein
MNTRFYGIILFFLSACLLVAQSGCIEKRELPGEEPFDVVEIFKQGMIHFNPDNPGEYETEVVSSLDNGRVITSTVEIPNYDNPQKITARVALYPIPKDDVSVFDKWDRAGNIRLSRDDMPDIEIIKFITAYGGFTEYEVDVSHLAPLLQGACTFKGFVDTWVTPGWKIDFSLKFTTMRRTNSPDWVQGIIYEESFNHANMGDEGVTIEVDIPDGLKQVKMNYLVSGHCTDGRDADEFVSKDNVIYVGKREVHRFKPWRDNCLQFRAINPYCRRWSDGSWSSDYSRSGWCPGDKVEPVRIDLTSYLTPGKHTIRFVVENIRPKDENDHFGYWRISGHLLGWKN